MMKTMLKRSLALMLTVLMVVGTMLPSNVFAAEDVTNGNTVHSVVYAQYQFSGMGRVNYAPDSVRQLVIEEINNRTNYEVYYFRTDYYHPFGKNLFKVGNHYFSSK